MTTTVIDRMYQDFTDLVNFLERAGEVSLRVVADNTFKKTLALSAASYFEDEVRRILLLMVTKRSSGDELMKNFITNKAIARQYHTFFQWKDTNANSFWGLFGEDFREAAKRDVRETEELAKSIREFLELGNMRNELAHLNFANFILDKTAEEVYELYRSSLKFTKYLEDKLLNYIPSSSAE